MATRRHKDWQQRLSDVVREHQEKPFDFKTLNCLFWAFKGIKAVIDYDNMPDYDGRSNSILDGKRALKQVDDCDTVQEVLAKRLGQELQHIAFARPGDIVFLNDKLGDFDVQQELKLFGPTPGICYGNGMNSLFLGETGLVELPTIRLDNTLWVS
jgi:hypothetical protein